MSIVCVFYTFLLVSFTCFSLESGILILHNIFKSIFGLSIWIVHLFNVFLYFCEWIRQMNVKASQNDLAFYFSPPQTIEMASRKKTKGNVQTGLEFSAVTKPKTTQHFLFHLVNTKVPSSITTLTRLQSKIALYVLVSAPLVHLLLFCPSFRGPLSKLIGISVYFEARAVFLVFFFASKKTGFRIFEITRYTRCSNSMKNPIYFWPNDGFSIKFPFVTMFTWNHTKRIDLCHKTIVLIRKKGKKAASNEAMKSANFDELIMASDLYSF